MPDAVAFTNGRVVSMDPAIGDAEALVVRDGRIAAVGPAGILEQHPDAKRRDLGGRTVTPGFIDAHHHLCFAALHPRWADLSGVAELDTLAARLRDAARREPDVPWIRGCGWDEPGTGLALSRQDLDSLGLDRPVIVGCFSYHRCVVSSAGLDALGISRSTPDPPNGRIERDERGEPTGVLTEGAWTSAHRASLAGYDDPDRWGEHIAAYARHLHTEGITAVHDAACSPEAEAVYRSLAAGGQLPVSVLMMPHGDLLAGPAPGRWDGPPTGEGGEQLRVGPVKLFADGGIELDIDAHLGDHHIAIGGAFPGLDLAVRTAVERGFGVAIHAMGNAGLRYAIAAWREALRADPDPAHGCRIEHVTLAGPDEVRDLAALGMTGVIQPNFVELIGRTIGNLRFDDATWLPFADLLDAGIALAASSDGPCSFTAPLIASRHGATRLTTAGAEVGTDQTIPQREWLRLYTAGAAAAGGQHDERGRLAPGLRADLVVLEGDIDRADELSVAETWIGGAPVSTRA